MEKRDRSKLAAIVEELQRDWPILVADEDLGQRFCALLDDEELEQALQGFSVSLDHDA